MREFNAQTDVDYSYCITLQNHGLSNDDYVIYSNNQNEDLSPLTDGTVYRVIREDDSKFKLADVGNPTTPLEISQQSNNEIHKLETAVVATLPGVAHNLFGKLDDKAPNSDVREFDARTHVDNSHCITLPSHGLSNGDYVIYSNGGNTNLSPLDNNELYKVILDYSDNENKIKLAHVDDPLGDPPLQISPLSNNEIHELETAVVVTLANRVKKLESSLSDILTRIGNLETTISEHVLFSTHGVDDDNEGGDSGLSIGTGGVDDDNEDDNEGGDSVSVIPTAAEYYEFRNASKNGNTITFTTPTSGVTAPVTVSGANTNGLDPIDGIHTGSSTHVKLHDYTFGSEWSIEVYFKFAQNTTDRKNQAIFGAGTINAASSSNPWIQIQRETTTDKLQFIVWTNSTPAFFSLVSTDDVAALIGTNFGHVVVAYSSSSGVSVYYDNNEIMSTSTALTIAGGTRNVYIGTNLSSAEDIKEDNTRRVAIYGSKLTASEVSALFAAKDTGLSPSDSADVQAVFVHSSAPQSDTDYTGSINAFTDPSNSSTIALPVTGTVTWGPNGLKTVSNSSVRLRAVQPIAPPFSFEWYGELPFTGTWQRVIGLYYLTTQYNLVLSRYGNSTTDIYFGDDSHAWNNNDTILSGNGVKAAIDTTNLQHVVCVAPSQGAMKMFINKVKHIANTTYTLPSANREIHIGRDGHGDSGEEVTRFVRFWDNRELTDTEVVHLYNAATGSSSSGSSPSGSGTPSNITTFRNFDFRYASKNGNTITFTNNDTASVIGTTPSEATLSSTNGVGTTNNSNISLTAWNFHTSFSIEIYFKVNGGSSNAIFGAWDGDVIAAGIPGGHSSRNNISFERLSGNKGSFWTGHSGAFDGADTVADMAGWDNTWGHVVLTHDPTNGKRIYVDQYEVNYSSTGTGYLTIPTSQRERYYIGSPTAYTADNANDNVRFMRYYDKVLSSSEVQELYFERDTGAFSHDILDFNLVTATGYGGDTLTFQNGGVSGSHDARINGTLSLFTDNTDNTVGQYVTFSDNTNYLDIEPFPMITDTDNPSVSFEVYFRWGTTDTSQRVFHFSNDNNTGQNEAIYLSMNSGKLQYVHTDGTTHKVLNSTSNYNSTTTWYHVVIVEDETDRTNTANQTTKMYVDKIEDATTNDTTHDFDFNTIERTFHGLGTNNTAYQGKKGKTIDIKFLRVHRKVLTSDEIEILYNNRNNDVFVPENV